MEPKDPKDSATQTVDAELVEIAKHPSVPVTLTDLAAMAEHGKQIIGFRVEILKTLRIESVRMTNPEDWLLFRAVMNGTEVITGYLQDSGAARVMPLWGMKVYIDPLPNGDIYEKTQDGEEFAYTIMGWGESTVTQGRTERHAGTRYSTEDFCKDIKSNLKRATYVKLAARANLDGHIVREIAGLERVPIHELEEAWKGTGKNINRCAKGRGFGSANERFGAESAEGIEPNDVPNCEVCESLKPPVLVRLVLRKGTGDREPFYGCPNYGKHPSNAKKVIIPVSELKKQIAERKGPSTQAAQQREPGDE